MFYLAGITEPGSRPDGVPHRVDVGEWYSSEEEARDRLGVVMSLSSLAFGDGAVESASWYLQRASVLPLAGFERTGYFYGYRLDDDTLYPIAGGFGSRLDADRWEPFLEFVERERAHAVGLPFLRDELRRFRLVDAMGEGRVNFSHFRFAPVSSELLVRPLNVCAGELLF